MNEKKKIGYKVIGIVKEIKGSCSAGHSVGDQIELSMHETGSLCGAFYHGIYPYVVMLQMGGSFPREWGDQDSIELACMDTFNAVKIELKRIKE